MPDALQDEDFGVLHGWILSGDKAQEAQAAKVVKTFTPEDWAGFNKYNRSHAEGTHDPTVASNVPGVGSVSAGDVVGGLGVARAGLSVVNAFRNAPTLLKGVLASGAHPVTQFGITDYLMRRFGVPAGMSEVLAGALTGYTRAGKPGAPPAAAAAPEAAPPVPAKPSAAAPPSAQAPGPAAAPPAAPAEPAFTPGFKHYGEPVGPQVQNARGVWMGPRSAVAVGRHGPQPGPTIPPPTEALPQPRSPVAAPSEPAPAPEPSAAPPAAQPSPAATAPPAPVPAPAPAAPKAPRVTKPGVSAQRPTTPDITSEGARPTFAQAKAATQKAAKELGMKLTGEEEKAVVDLAMQDGYPPAQTLKALHAHRAAQELQSQLGTPTDRQVWAEDAASRLQEKLGTPDDAEVAAGFQKKYERGQKTAPHK